jgi:hypothetical protein
MDIYAKEPKLTPCEKTKISKRIKFSQFSSKACIDTNKCAREKEKNIVEIVELSSLFKIRNSP